MTLFPDAPRPVPESIYIIHCGGYRRYERMAWPRDGHGPCWGSSYDRPADAPRRIPAHISGPIHRAIRALGPHKPGRRIELTIAPEDEAE